jgi:alpha-tubulin suppressor-like RCC1 family protein
MQPAGAAVHCWGLNTGGQLGDGQTANRATPAPISGGLSASEISAGEAHTCIVTSGSNPNRVYCWGANAAGQLGNGAATPRETTPQLVVER